jgi:hypothetical protein
VKFTGLSIWCSLGLIVSVIASYPRISAAKQQSEHFTVAKEVSQKCLLVEEGQIAEGFFYAARLDPTKQWYWQGKPTTEGQLLSGNNQFLCDSQGNTAEVGRNGVAQNVRTVTPEQMREWLKKRFGGESVNFSLVAVRSTRFLPNFEKREQERKEKEAADKKLIKF